MVADGKINTSIIVLPEKKESVFFQIGLSDVLNF
jgi:hypothetical protein